ncbi:hypothetical protein N7470_003849 [Penicillium chermesinum]|nr:hypothetical protein N7470_003849 [Penicillium chermesinum]
MSHNILITGASGYLGGTLLARWGGGGFRPTRSCLPCLKNEAEIKSGIVDNEISVIFFLIDALTSKAQLPMIRALAEVKKQTGKDVHFLHTSGAKIFSSHAGLPHDRPLHDDDPQLYDFQKSAKPAFPPMQMAVATNNAVIETAEAHGVRSYIFVPCIVYGRGEGFGNPISIQTVAIVNAARKLEQVYRPDQEIYSWPVCHVIDNTRLYLEIMRNILSGKNIAHGKNGYYLASSGPIVWDDLYRAMAKGLAKRGVVKSDSVEVADDAALQAMGEALGCPKEAVSVHLGGSCTLTPNNACKIGWAPEFAAQHALEVADDEVDLILKSSK